MRSLAVLCAVLSLSAPSPALHEMEAHRYVFVIGAHHSGTSLLKELLALHPNISTHTNTTAPENEGAHLQSVYKTTADLGDNGVFAHHVDAYMDENHALVTNENREKLFGEWARHWDNMSKPILVEKSPRHTMMTRYLQEMFGGERTSFLIVLRHPLGTAHRCWAYDTRCSSDCGAKYIEHWLKIHETLAADISHLRHAAVIQYEHFVDGDSQAILDAALKTLGISPGIRVQSIPYDKRTDKTVERPWMHAHRRGLLEYHGSRANIAVIKGSEFTWLQSFTKYETDNHRMECSDSVTAYETRVNAFGYSLVNMKKYADPGSFSQWLIK